MADYISKNEVLNLIMHNDKVCHYADERYENVVYATAKTICKVVADMPATDVQPVKHGRWSECYTDTHHYSGICSVCGKASIKSLAESLYAFCPKCGARMDGET